ncbi:MAG: histidinol-phosphate transaminase [Rhodospirillales bacterium]|nr:histidinol-phosphate transaminase [Rhodospirillales bacterium]
MTGPQPRPEVLGVQPYVGGESHLPGVNRTIKLSSNEGAFGAPPGALAAYHAIAEEMFRYPDGGADRLREAIGRRFGLNPARIACGTGSDDLIGLLCHAYGGAGRDIVMSEHGFMIYQIAGTASGSRVVKAPERNLTADLDAMLAAVSPSTRLVFLANPNNPTGTMVPADDVARFRAALPPDILFVLDSAYAEYIDRSDYDAGEKLVGATDNTVMLRTFSKVFGMGGMRVGWAYGPPAVIDVLNRVREAFNVSVPAQAAAIAALQEPGWVEKVRDHNTLWRARLADGLRAAGITVWSHEGNFVLADFGTPEVANAADAFLRGRGIIVRKVGGYGLPHCLRITVGTADEVGLVIETLTAFMGQRRG